MYDINQLREMRVPKLRELAEQMSIKGYRKLNKLDLIYKILDEQAVAGGSPDEGATEEPEVNEPAATDSDSRGAQTEFDDDQNSNTEEEDGPDDPGEKPERRRRNLKVNSVASAKDRMMY
mgnify:FL=1